MFFSVIKQSFFLFVFLGVFCPAPVSFTAEVSENNEVIREALRLRDAGFYAEAEKLLLNALTVDPGNAEYHFELANVYAAAFDAQNRGARRVRSPELLEKSAEQFRQCLMIDPDFLAAHYNLAVVYKRQEEPEKARESLRQVIEIDPKSTAAWMQIGATYQAQGFFDEAGDAYRKAQEIDYFNPDIRSAIEDLGSLRENYRLTNQADLANQFQTLNRNFRYSSFSHASDYEKARQLDQNQGLGVGSAVPYLASMVIDELMEWRARRKENQ